MQDTCVQLCSVFSIHRSAYCVSGTLLWWYSGSFISFCLISCLTLAKFEMLFFDQYFTGTAKIHSIIGP